MFFKGIVKCIIHRDIWYYEPNYNMHSVDPTIPYLSIY